MVSHALSIIDEYVMALAGIKAAANMKDAAIGVIRAPKMYSLNLWFINNNVPIIAHEKNDFRLPVKRKVISTKNRKNKIPDLRVLNIAFFLS